MRTGALENIKYPTKCLRADTADTTKKLVPDVFYSATGDGFASLSPGSLNSLGFRHLIRIRAVLYTVGTDNIERHRPVLPSRFT